VATRQLDDLDALVQAGATAPGPSGPHLRILATHHPVHFPPARPRYEMVIANERAVGKRLEAATRPVHLVLSGHTHALFPEHGVLPRSPRDVAHDPLGTDQCQLVIGTLMQVDRFGKRGDHPHQAEILRFYQDPTEPGAVVVERCLAARNPYGDPVRLEYEFVPVPGTADLAEEMLLLL
jgi:hypothetical protein